MSYVTIVVGDKSTGQVLNGDSGLGEPDESLVFVAATAAFNVGDLVWVSDDDSPGERGTIEAIVLNTHLDLDANLVALYSVAQNAKVVIARDISNDAINVDTWRNRLSCIGTCKLRLDNSDNKYEGLFDPDDPIIISIVGTIMWGGLMDDVRPYLPEKGVLTNELVMTGRDYGRYLVDNSFTKKYPTGYAADIVDDILSILGDPLLYTDDGEYGGEAQIKYEGTRAKLGDALREICELSGRDFYIDNNGRLHLFEAGQAGSGVDLFLIATDPTNNLLTFEEYEKVGTSIKNSIEIHAGSVKDHYSDGNSADFSVGGAGARADSATHIYGSQSIEFTCTDPATVFLEFDQNPVLADYGYSGSVDLSKLCEAKVMIRGTRTGKTVFSLRPFLVDGGGNKIVFCRVGPDATIGGKGGSKGWTENIVTWDHRAFWTQLSYPLGAHDSNPIKPGPGLTTGFWCADDADITFDWTDVWDIGFEYPFTENAVILIDGWCIPSLEAKSIQQDTGVGSSQALYGKRMYSEFRKEMRTQKQIILYAKKVLALRKDPIQKFKGVAKGQVLTKYAAQTVDVNVPAFGIIAEPYTITALHHKLHHGRDVRGWDFLTEYELAAQDAPASIVLLDDNPLEMGMDRLALANRGYKGGMAAEDSLLGDMQSGRFTQETKGTYFPIYPADGDLHWLTADFDDTVYTGFQYYGLAGGILYTYDEGATKWIRAPCELGRRADPPPVGSGGGPYTGDTYYHTTDEITYQWDGAAWEAVSQMGEFVIAAGTSFPAGVVGSYFYRTDLDTLFRCESTGPDVWEKVVFTTGEGTSFPAKATLGTLFYRSDEGVLYRCTEDICTIAAHWDKVMRISRSGTYAARPASGDVAGEWYYSTDTMELYRWTGAAWEKSLQKVRSVATVADLAGLANVATGDTCYVVAAAQTFYYNGANWIPLATIAHQGTTVQRAAFESEASEGDIFYDTDLKQFFRWTGAAWEAKTTWSHDDLDDVSANDHHTAFTSGNHAVIEHTASMLNQAIQPYNSNITFARKAGFEHNAITYTSGEIKFQDGTARTITSAGELTALPIGYNFIYFRTDSASLFATTDHATAISAGRGILAIIVVVSADDSDIPCAIQPFYAKGLNVTADTMAVTLLSAITSHLGNVDVADGNVLLGDDGITIKGNLLRLRSADGSKLGILYLGATGDLQIGGDPAADITKFADATIQFATAVTLRPLLGGALAKLGTPSYPFRYFTPTTNLAGRPGAAAGIVGLQWITREADPNDKSILWVCMQNDADGYEWVQRGIST